MNCARQAGRQAGRKHEDSKAETAAKELVTKLIPSMFGKQKRGNDEDKKVSDYD